MHADQQLLAGSRRPSGSAHGLGAANRAAGRCSYPYVRVSAADLLQVPEGAITEKGLRQNVNVGILYLEAWLGALGCVPLYNLMEDAATAEISRTQLWQWLHHNAKLDDGREVTPDLYRHLRDEELTSIRKHLGDARVGEGYLDRAVAIFDRLITSDELADFLTIPAYDELLRIEKGA